MGVGPCPKTSTVASPEKQVAGTTLGAAEGLGVATVGVAGAGVLAVGVGHCSVKQPGPAVGIGVGAEVGGGVGSGVAIVGSGVGAGVATVGAGVTGAVQVMAMLMGPPM